MNPHPYFSLFGIRLTSHGLLFALGAEVAGVLLLRRAAAKQLDTTRVWPLTAISFASGLVGARLLFVALYWDQIGSLVQVFRIWQGGLVSYGGILAGTVAAWFYLSGQNRSKWADAALPALLVGWGIGRIGNFLAGDSVGIVSGLFATTYGRVPIQLFETGLCWILAIALWQRSNSALLGGILYFAGRAIIDSWRDEPLVAGIHPSSLTSLFFCLLLTIWYALGSTRRLA